MLWITRMSTSLSFRWDAMLCRRVWHVILKGALMEEQRTTFLKLSSMVRMASRLPFFEMNKAGVSQIQTTYLSHPEPDLVHQCIDGIIPNAQNGSAVNGIEQDPDLTRRQSAGALPVTLTDFEHIIKRQGMSLWHIVKFQVVAVASERMDFAVDGTPTILALVFKVILEVDHDRSVDASTC
jgi:hypothetical protein